MADDYVKIRGSSSAYKKFINSAIHTDLTNEIDELLEGSVSDYDNAETMEQVARIQGRRDALKHLRELPEAILAALLEEEDGE